MKLIMLGTGHATVTKCYNTCFLLQETEPSCREDQYFLVDGGGGNMLLRQLETAKVSWKAIRTIFVTHKHMDHILGILWMIRMAAQGMNQGKYEGDLTIYGHDEVVHILKDMARSLLQEKEAAQIGSRIHLVTVQDAEAYRVLGKKITFFDIHSTKAKQFGFSIELEDGQKLTCCGDEPYSEFEAEYVKDCKWLLHEAFCLYAEADLFKPYEKHHSTAKDACEIAEKMNVENIILYHTEDKNLSQRREKYTAEGADVYHGNILVPDDFDVINL